MKRGLFISFEGCDGCGKTTALNLVKEKLHALNIDPLFTREPGGSKIAEQIRNIILDPKNTEEDCRTEALLYAASRRQHLIDVVLPALEEGRMVISDRYLDSSSMSLIEESESKKCYPSTNSQSMASILTSLFS